MMVGKGNKKSNQRHVHLIYSSEREGNRVCMKRETGKGEREPRGKAKVQIADSRITDHRSRITYRSSQFAVRRSLQLTLANSAKALTKQFMNLNRSSRRTRFSRRHRLSLALVQTCVRTHTRDPALHSLAATVTSSDAGTGVPLHFNLLRNGFRVRHDTRPRE
jgi:hypothetical protein